MNLLLDTHALLLWLSNEPSLSPASRNAIADPMNTVFLSAVVVWEIHIKHATGKLDLPARFRDVLGAEPFAPLPITLEHAHAVAGLPPIHRDPFDRMLIAQASTEKMSIATRDPEIAKYDVKVIVA